MTIIAPWTWANEDLYEGMVKSDYRKKVISQHVWILNAETRKRINNSHIV